MSSIFIYNLENHAGMIWKTPPDMLPCLIMLCHLENNVKEYHCFNNNMLICKYYRFDIHI